MSDSSTSDYPYAGFWHRFAALFIDGLILIIPNIIVNHVLPVAGSVLLFLFYKPVFESSALLGTPGKSLMGIVVLTEDGGRMTFKQALVRTLMSLVSGMCLMIGYFLCFFTARHQALHDLVAGTIVINQEMPKDNYFDIWLNEMKYIFGRGSSEIFGEGPRATEAGAANFSTSARGEPRDVGAMDALEKLHKLYTDGAITEAEFNAKKAELLKRI